MAVLSVTRSMARTGTDQVEDGQAKVVEPYNVLTDDPNDSLPAMLVEAQDLGLPGLGDPHPDSTSLFVNDRSFTCEDNGKLWRVMINYSTNARSDDELIPDPNPCVEVLSKPERIAVGFAHGEEVAEFGVYRGYEGRVTPGEKFDVIQDIDYDPEKRTQAIVNSAGIAFDEPLTRPSSVVSLSIQRNVLDVDFQFYAEYRNTVNQDTWLGFEPNSWMVRDVQASQEEHRGCLYFTETWELWLNPRTWLSRVLDQGTQYKYQITVGSNTITVIRNAKGVFTNSNDVEVEGEPLNEPVLLDGQGGRLDTQTNEEDVEANGQLSVFRRFDLFERKPFKALGFFVNTRARVIDTPGAGA